MINVVPTPKGICGGEKILFFEPIISKGDFDFEAKVFADDVKKTHGLNFTFVENGIKTVKSDILKEGEYKIEISEKGICVFALDKEGAAYAFVTLLQMIEAREGKIKLPKASVWDAPELMYRGLLVDCARSFHNLDELKAYVDICRFYKIKYLHLHLSDDESYTLPSKKYPLLTSKERFFTNAEIAELDKYAYEHNVQIVPEVDTPGHSTAMQKAYPEIFGDKGILCFCEKTLNAVADIYREVCEMFPHSDYIHIGGDESRLGWWVDWKECTEYGKKCGYSIDDDAPGMTGAEYIMLRYLAHFIKHNCEVVRSMGKRPIVWEGFHKVTNEMIPDYCAVMIFDCGYQLPHELLKRFDVINCSWLPTYVVTPTWYYPPRDCYNWDVTSYGSINESSPYYNGNYKLSYSEKMIGGQLSSWGDTIEKAFKTPADGHADELLRIRERLPYIAENTWNREKRTDYDTVRGNVSRTEKILGSLIGK